MPIGKRFIIGVGGGVVTDITGLCRLSLYAWRKIWFCANKYFGNGRCEHWRKKWRGCGRV